MNWNAISAAAEVLGATGVILSLLYLALELRQSNKLARRSAAQELLAALGNFNRYIAQDAELSGLFWKGVDSPDALSQVEWRRFMDVSTTLIRHFEAVFLDQAEGLLPKGVWISQDNSLRRWMSRPGLHRSLNELKSDFDSGFVEYVLAEVNVPER